MLILFHDGWKISSDADKAEVFQKVFYQGKNLRDKYFNEPFLNVAVSDVNVALNESRNNLERNSINDICHDINRRITKNKVVAAIRRADGSKCVDLYGLHSRFLFFYAQLKFTSFQHVFRYGFLAF